MLLGSANGSVQGDSLLLELEELLELPGELALLELDDERLLLELDERLDALDSEELDPLPCDELLLGDEGKLLLEDDDGGIALLDDPLDSDEPLDRDDELLDGGVYTLPELRLDRDELPGGGGRTGGGGVGPHGGAQFGGYGGYGGKGGNGGYGGKGG